MVSILYLSFEVHWGYESENSYVCTTPGGSEFHGYGLLECHQGIEDREHARFADILKTHGVAEIQANPSAFWFERLDELGENGSKRVKMEIPVESGKVGETFLAECEYRLYKDRHWVAGISQIPVFGSGASVYDSHHKVELALTAYLLAMVKIKGLENMQADGLENICLKPFNSEEVINSMNRLKIGFPVDV